jgi:hypothetical protein
MSLRTIYKHLDTQELLKRAPQPFPKETDKTLLEFFSLSKTQRKKYLRFRKNS